MTMGEKIAAQRRSKGMSQEALAGELGITRQAVSRWETGEAVPDTDKVVRLSRLFGVSTDYLLLDEMENADMPAAAADTSAGNAALRNAVVERRRRFRIVTGIVALALGLAAIVAACVLAVDFAETTYWWNSDLGPIGTGLLQTWRATPFWLGVISALTGAGLLVWEYLRKD